MISSDRFIKPAFPTCLVDKARGTTGRSGQNGGEIRWPPMGRTGGHHWGDSTAAYGENPMAAVTGPRDPVLVSGRRARRAGEAASGGAGWLGSRGYFDNFKT